MLAMNRNVSQITGRYGSVKVRHNSTLGGPLVPRYATVQTKRKGEAIIERFGMNNDQHSIQRQGAYLMAARFFPFLIPLIASPFLLAAQENEPKQPKEPVAIQPADEPAEPQTPKPNDEQPSSDAKVKENVPSRPADEPVAAKTEVTAKEGKDAKKEAKEQAKKQEPASKPTLQIDPSWVDALNWRSIGPASMGGRIVDVEVVESDPIVFYVATASGGLFKTTNNGTTFQPVFEKEKTVSIGDVAVSVSNPDIVWVGTGEHNARNSVSWGDGVYKSSDGGKSWTHMGLERTFQIGRIAIHPTNPEIVYVGALGRLWGTNEERGLYKTTDGGKTWQKVLSVDEKTGCVDIAMHPDDPETLLAVMYERQRDRFEGANPAKRWGPGSGLYKTTDGGANWKKLTEGLPNRPLGRIGVCYYPKKPDTVFAIVESDKIGHGRAGAYMGISGGGGSGPAEIQRILNDGPASIAGLLSGDQVLEIDGNKIETYNDLVLAIRKHEPEQKSSLKIKRGDEEKTLEITWGKRPGNASATPFTSYIGGQRANAQDQQGPEGNDTGGVYKSVDGGETWQRINSLNPRPFYYSQIRVDPSDDQHVYVLGIAFHSSDNGGAEFKTASIRVHPDHHALWIDPRDGRRLILGCDGGLYVSYDRGQTWDFHNILAIGQFYDVAVDTRRPYRVYGGLQDNGSWGGPSRTRGRYGPSNADWYRVGGADGFVCRVDPNEPDLVYYEAQFGRIGRVNVRTGERASIRPKADKNTKYRFNWRTPYLLSNHNSRIFYCAGNFVFRSLDRGNDLRKISPEITASDRGSATALAESPSDPNILYVGTDDGALWVTRDGGNEWQDITKNLGLAEQYLISSIEASRHEPGRAYVALDGHRSDNDAPHVFGTEDYGETWHSIVGNLPDGSTRCVREDVANPDLLYCGTEFAIWASLDRGGHWTRINSNLPTVAIHEIAVHPLVSEIVVGTHGRSLWALDVTPLRGFTKKVAAAKAHLFKPPAGILWGGALASSHSGNRHFFGQNPDFGTGICYYLGADVTDAVLEIRDIRGNVVRQLPTDKKKGLHRVTWDLRRGTSAPRGGQRAQRTGPSVTPGVYLARLTADGKQFEHEIKVEADPEFPSAMLLEEVEEHERKHHPEFVE